MRKIAIVPYGVGIGDIVNMRPIAEAVRRAFPAAEVAMVIPEDLAWLLPDSVKPVRGAHGLAAWHRPHPAGRLTRAAARLSVGSLAPLVRRLPTTALATALAYDLRLQGFDRVINLLQAFSRLDLDRRWTSGPWSTDRRHVIDLLTPYLNGEGIPLLVEERCPRVSIPPAPLGTSPSVILNPCAGSMLKEPPLYVWVSTARALVRRGISPFVILTPGRDTAHDVARQVPNCVLLASNDVKQVTRWIAGADVVVSPDTGFLHLASAAGTRYVGLFGSTDPLFLGPYSREMGTIVESDWQHSEVCRSCWTSQIVPAALCPLYVPDSCLAGIPAQRVVDAIDAQLNAPLHLNVQASRAIACGRPHEESPSSIEQGAG